MYSEVILPIPLNRTFTYTVPDALLESVTVGKRVLVQFGKSKIYSAVVRRLHDKTPTYETKEIIEVIDDEPVVIAKQFQLWEWMADYYMCSPGEVMNAALPAALKLESESTVQLNPLYEGDGADLTDREYLVFEALQTEPVLPIKEVEKILGIKTVFKVLKKMAEKNVVLLNEEVRKKIKAKFISMVSLSSKCDDEDFMKSVFEDLEKKAPKQLDLLMHFLNLTTGEKEKSIPRTKLLKIANATAATLTPLLKKGVLEIIEISEADMLNATSSRFEKSVLNEVQQQALKEMNEQFEQHQVVLLHGITSSGKTEIYIHQIEEQIKNGKQVLYLLPEIALTTQMIVRLRKYFGDNLLVYHSRYNDSERLLTYNRMLRFDDERKINPNAYQIIIGARSALFLPFTNLGLVIVDEEHESSYKQFDPAPRYHARDSAIVLAQFSKAKTILGSATPSMESYYNAMQNKFGLVKMDKRFANMELPEIVVVDIKEAYRKKKMKTEFSIEMLEQLGNALKQNEQVILFQNRRGFSTILQCTNCAWIPHCINCDVSLTYHKNSNHLLCHYCGYKTSVPQKCKACAGTDIRMKGIGTERVEEDLQVFFPEKKIARLDVDTARSKHAYHQILNDFGNGNIDVLVGTQMVTKGLDFDNVTTVGIINADSLMSYPDFRASERGFQLMSQVSGRSGRKNKRGKVIVQTFNPTSKTIAFVVNHDFNAFYEYELAERKKFNYPPFVRIIEIAVKHKDMRTSDDAAEILSRNLRNDFGKRVLGPVLPPVSRINNYHIRNIVLKIEREASVKETKKLIRASMEMLIAQEPYRYCVIQLDVDAM